MNQAASPHNESAAAGTIVPEPLPVRSMEELFAMLESVLLGYAMRILRDQSVAEDVVQEAFMKLHVQFATVEDPKRWLYRTVHNLSLNQLRQASKIVPFDPTQTAGSSRSSEAELIDPTLHPDQAMMRGEGIRLVQVSLETLDERSREVLRLKFSDGLSYKEISERTGLTTGHVGYLIHHGVKAVGMALSKAEVAK